MEVLSRIGIHTSSVHPGYTVDSYMTISPSLSIDPISFDADSRKDKSGCWELLIGVGTQIM